MWIVEAIRVVHTIIVIVMFIGICRLFYAAYRRKINWNTFDNIVFTLVITIYISNFILGGCPLTILENMALAKYSPELVYYESFIHHFVQTYIGIYVGNGLTNTISVSVCSVLLAYPIAMKIGKFFTKYLN